MHSFLYSSHRFFSSFLRTSTDLVILNLSSSLSENLISSTVSEHLFLPFLLLKIPFYRKLQFLFWKHSLICHLLNLFQCGKERKLSLVLIPPWADCHTLFWAILALVFFYINILFKSDFIIYWGLEGFFFFIKGYLMYNII